MDKKNIVTALIGITVGGMFGIATQVSSQEYEKFSPTELIVNTSISSVVSLSDLKIQLAEVQAAKKIEVDRSSDRISQFNELIEELTLKISRAEDLGIVEKPVEVVE